MVAAFLPFAMAQDNAQRAIVPTNVSSCESYTWAANGQTYTADTVVTYINATDDTVFVLNLTINTPWTNTESITSDRCSYTWRGNSYYASGLYSDTVTAVAGSGLCDSIYNVMLIIPMTETVSTSVEACGSYEWHNETYTTSGSYSDTTAIPIPSTSFICSHIDVLNLDIVNVINVNDFVANCGKYNWYDSVYTATGVYTYTTHDTTIGCDTLHTLNLTIVVDTIPMVVDSACATKTWQGHTYDVSGIYSDLDTNANTQCVTYRSIDLRIKPLREAELDTALTGCNSVLFNISSMMGTTVKRFSQTMEFDTNLTDIRWNKCLDSTIHIDVTIHKSGYDSTYAIACDSFYWRYNKQTYYKTPATAPSVAFATDTFGCDSMMTLFLTIKKSPVISAINGEWNLEAGQTAVLYPTCTEGAAYKWTYGDQTSTADTLRIENVQGNIDVSLEATLNYAEDNFACHDTSWITIVTFVGINGVENTTVSLYPNPAVGQLNIECGEAIREVVIFNTLGQQVAVNSNLGNKSLLNLSNLAKGTYTMRVVLENGETVIRKFVLTK